MADKTINDLSAISTLDDNDLLAVYQSASSSTLKVTLGELEAELSDTSLVRSYFYWTMEG